MESELFGHIKGSFSGAVADNEGLFQAADGGTLFLDEIGELPLNMQVKLLRAIQEKTIRPIGTHQERPVDVRILSATHKDLAALAETGEFRKDLFYRINVIELFVPPLRERKGDIPLLVQHIIENMPYSTGNGVRERKLSDKAMQALMEYPFPGNVRELENIIQRAITLCEGNMIEEEDLQLIQQNNDKTIDNQDDALDSFLNQQERQKILAALEQTKWNRTAAAKILGISFRALRYRLEKLGID